MSSLMRERLSVDTVLFGACLDHVLLGFLAATEQ